MTLKIKIINILGSFQLKKLFAVRSALEIPVFLALGSFEP